MVKRKVLHIITGLGTGGAEMMLYKLIQNSDKSIFEHIVISLSGCGELGKRIEEEGVIIYTMEIRKKLCEINKLFVLYRLIRKIDPNIVQTWMYHGDLIGGGISRLCGINNIVWNIRHSDLKKSGNKKSTILVAKLCAISSKYIPKVIISCSKRALVVHENYGYRKDIMQVIPNGFDLERFKRNENSRMKIEKELNLVGDEILVGMVARFNPQKDHRTLLMAASLVDNDKYNIKYILCGSGVDSRNEELSRILNELAELKGKVFLLGERSDIESIHGTLDVECLTSAFGEGFPNVVGEAMASEVPCIVTDVGDSSYVVGDEGIVVPPGDHVALAQAIERLAGMDNVDRKKIGIKARRRINEKFSIETVVKKYESLYIGMFAESCQKKDVS